MSFYRTFIFVLLLMLMAMVICKNESEGLTYEVKSNQIIERLLGEESGNEINEEQETNLLKNEDKNTLLPDFSDNSMMSFDNCTTEGFSCFFPVVDEDHINIKTNYEKKKSQILSLIEVKQEHLAKYHNSSTLIITREGSESMEIDITLGEDINQFMFTIEFQKQIVTLNGKKDDTSISLNPRRPFICISRRHDGNSWLRVTLLLKEVQNPGNEMIEGSQQSDESEENGNAVKNAYEKAKKTKKKFESTKHETLKVIDEKEKKISTRSLIIIISVSSILVLFLIAVLIVGVVQCRLNKCRSKTRKMSSTKSSTSVNENQLNLKASETRLVKTSLNESEGELVAKTASNSPFRSDTVSESVHSAELIPLARSVSAKSFTHSRRKRRSSRRKSIGKEGKNNTLKTETPMKTIPLHQKREVSNRRKEGSGRRNDGSSMRK